MIGNVKNSKADKIIDWVMSGFLGVIGSIVLCGFVCFFVMLASIVGNYVYGIVFVVMFIILMLFFLQIANGTDKDDEDDV